MIVGRCSNLTGEWHEMDLPITEEALQRYENGEGTVQDIFPSLPPEQREFLMTGITPEEWKRTFGTGDEEEKEEDVETDSEQSQLENVLDVNGLLYRLKN